jgi:hypothetical protein
VDSSTDEVIGFCFSIYLILPAALWPWGVDSVSNINEYQDSSLRAGGGGKALLSLKAYSLTAVCELIV